jgi:hypothetical protein
VLSWSNGPGAWEPGEGATPRHWACRLQTPMLTVTHGHHILSVRDATGFITSLLETALGQLALKRHLTDRRHQKHLASAQLTPQYPSTGEQGSTSPLSRDPTCHFTSLRFKYPPLSAVLNLCSSLNMRDSVHTHEEVKQVLHILTFTSSGSRRQDNRF